MFAAVVHQRHALKGRTDEGRGEIDFVDISTASLPGTQTRQTNGFIEAINGLFQAAKRKARGYARFKTMRTVLFLIAGKARLYTL